MGWLQDLKNKVFPPREEVNVWPAPAPSYVELRSADQQQTPMELTERLPTEEPKIKAESSLFKPASTPRKSPAAKKRQSTTVRKRDAKKAPDADG